MTGERPLRILQVVGGMNRGGTETWLMHILRHIDRTQFQMDFLVHRTEPGAYDEEIRALGSQIIPCLRPDKPWIYARNFKRILRDYGPYDIVHSHVHHYTGYVLRLAYQAGIPVRVVHSHSDTATLRATASPARQVYLNLMQRWIRQYASAGLAASQKAAASLFGLAWQADTRWRIMYCSIDLTPFSELVDRAVVRAELGIPGDALVVGHVGRFTEVKNHRFIINIMSELIKRVPNSRLVLVGGGPLYEAIQQQVTAAGLADYVIFTGLRSDVPRLMLGAMDVFVMPSFYEGLPLVSLEVQAAGLPLLISDNITSELAVVPVLVAPLSIAQPAASWAEVIIARRNQPPPISQPCALERVAQSAFSIQTGVKELEEVYREYTSR